MRVIKTILKGLLGLVAVLVAIVVLVAIFADKPPTTVAQPQQIAPTQAQATPPPIVLPSEEQGLLHAVDRGASDYGAASNDMAKGGSKQRRAAAICAAVPTHSARNWRGTIETLSSNGDGKGVLAVRLSPTVVVKTWNNALSDIGSDTLISASSTVFAQASALTVGQPVIFSGTFFPSQTDCLQEVSMTLAGSMTEPDFIFKFTDIKAAP